MVALAVAGTLVCLWWLCDSAGKLNVLPSQPPAQWILYPTPANGDAHPTVELSTQFRRNFVLPRPASTATLSIRALSRFDVLLNGKPVNSTHLPQSNWRCATTLQISNLLQPGTNELAVTVFSSNSLPALWLTLSGDDFQLFSDETWQASFGGGTWMPARLAALPLAIRPGNRLFATEEPVTSLRRNWPVFLVLAWLAAGLSVWMGWKQLKRLGRSGVQPNLSAPKKGAAQPSDNTSLPQHNSKQLLACLLVLIVTWAVLWTNNLGRLPREIGFDAAEHLKYIQYILDKGVLPLANEGWEMYQPPLYYLISAGLLRSFHLSTNTFGGIALLRVFGLACGIATVVLVFLCLRLLFPNRTHCQLFGLLLAATLPVNLYLGQYVTNEFLASTLVTVSLYLCLRIICAGRVGVWNYVFAGGAMGAALLTKSSAFLAVPAILAALAWDLWKRGIRDIGHWATNLGALLGICLVVCGWHYYRTAIHFGTPIPGNWDARSGFSWWQQPGYRTASSFLQFGHCLVHPYYSGFASIPDGLYSTLWGDGLYGGGADYRVRPPWNYGPLTAGYLFALTPTLAILIGVVVGAIEFYHKPKPGTFLMLSLASISVALLLYYALRVPSYASAKVFYILPVLVPLCVFAALGLDILSQKAGRACVVVYFLFGLWALNSYVGFWIRGEAPATKILAARTYATENRHDLAVAQLQSALEKEPHNVAATYSLAIERAREGRLSDATELARAAVQWDSEDAEARLVLGTLLFQQGKLPEAIEQARRAVQLAPDHPKAASSLFAWLYRSGAKSEAAAACAESLRVNPFNPEFHYGMAIVERDLGDRTNAQEHARLAQDLQRGLKLK